MLSSAPLKDLVNYMFNLLVEALETCRKFWKDCVASRPEEICCLDVT